MSSYKVSVVAFSLSQPKLLNAKFDFLCILKLLDVCCFVARVCEAAALHLFVIIFITFFL